MRAPERQVWSECSAFLYVACVSHAHGAFFLIYDCCAENVMVISFIEVQVCYLQLFRRGCSQSAMQGSGPTKVLGPIEVLDRG